MDHSIIRSIEDLQAKLKPESRVLTLFSGGLDSAYLLHLLKQFHCAQVVALTVDLGDGVDREEIETLARGFGAQSVILDKREEFANHYVAPAIYAHAEYLGVHPVSSSLSRPLIAKTAVEVAKKMGCDVILHTANQSQNSLRRLNGAIRQLGFTGLYGTPYEFSAVSREEKAEQLQAAGVDLYKSRKYSGDSNLWCREFESGLLDDPEQFLLSDDLYQWSASEPSQDSMELELTFKQGLPVAVNGTEMKLVDLIAFLNEFYGAYGLGRYVGLEHLVGGEKVLEVREMPAAHLLLYTYRQLETACVNAETIREKMSLEQVWVREAIEGRWFDTLKQATEAFLTDVSKRVSGTVSYTLHWRQLAIRSIRAEQPLYLRDRDAWEKEVAQAGRLQPVAATV